MVRVEPTAIIIRPAKAVKVVLAGDLVELVLPEARLPKRDTMETCLE